MLHIVLACIGQESANERYCSTVKDLLLPNSVSQKGEKPNTAGLDDTAIPFVKIKITEIPHEKTYYRNIYVNPNFPLLPTLASSF